jgi:hypothetical protein
MEAPEPRVMPTFCVTHFVRRTGSDSERDAVVKNAQIGRAAKICM